MSRAPRLGPLFCPLGAIVATPDGHGVRISTEIGPSLFTGQSTVRRLEPTARMVRVPLLSGEPQMMISSLTAKTEKLVAGSLITEPEKVADGSTRLERPTSRVCLLLGKRVSGRENQAGYLIGEPGSQRCGFGGSSGHTSCTADRHIGLRSRPLNGIG
jgi:hypothetical protein